MNDFDREVEENLPLVSYVLQKYYHKWNEDMFQIGCVGLIKGVKTFDPKRRVSKSTYYTSCIRNEIYSTGRFNNTQKRGVSTITISLNTKIKNHDNLELEELIGDENNLEESLIKKETIAQLYEVIKELSSKEKIIITYTFGLFNQDKKTQQELADILEMSQAQVSRKIKRILIKLKGKMEDKNKTL